jgi:hypothetical protein
MAHFIPIAASAAIAEIVLRFHPSFEAVCLLLTRSEVRPGHDISEGVNLEAHHHGHAFRFATGVQTPATALGHRTSAEIQISFCTTRAI